MNDVTQYTANMAMEATIMLFLILLLITSTWQKKLFATTVYFCNLLRFLILLLVNQVVIWSFLNMDIQAHYGAMPMRAVYLMDYIFGYGFSVTLYYYVEAMVKEGSARTHTSYTPNKKIHRIMNIWGAVSALGYGILLFVPAVYHIENGETVFSIPAYVIMEIVVKFALFCTIALIVRHTKEMGKIESALCMTFVVLVSGLIVVDELCGLCISYVLMSLFTFILFVRVDLYKGLQLERQEKEIVLWRTEIMLSQMQPHFLYNILTTISSLCEMQNALQARDVVNRFSDYFRTNLDSLGSDKMISFEKELEHVKTYLWLEKIRFEDALNISYDIATTDFYLPSLTVQPMVENAVKHGIRSKEDVGTVTIRSYEKEDSYVIEVVDDGVGFDTRVRHEDGRSHVGIDNVQKRLEVFCEGRLDINSEVGKGTLVTISIPKRDRL